METISAVKFLKNVFNIEIFFLRLYYNIVNLTIGAPSKPKEIKKSMLTYFLKALNYSYFYLQMK